MFEFTRAPVPVRPDLRYSYVSLWEHLARPGPTLSGFQRISLLDASRSTGAEAATAESGLEPALGLLADSLYHDPIAVDGTMVRTAADAAGDPQTVEVAALVSMLSSVDGTHRALGAELEPLPEPHGGQPTGEIAEGLKRRRTHLPVPPGPIPVMFDLLPYEGAVFQSLFGPQYMTGWEMALDTFQRSPGLNRAQMELVSSRTSIHNECFY
ncbi:MAG: hypothetical protein QNJ71_11380 [Acidimicrobiia bacterium]|nr:hypothetical protein [Acidimicrobiia bacterium]